MVYIFIYNDTTKQPIASTTLTGIAKALEMDASGLMSRFSRIEGDRLETRKGVIYRNCALHRSKHFKGKL